MPSRPWRERGAVLVVVAALVAVTGACAEPEPAGVTVKDFDDNLVFGVKEDADATGANSLGGQLDPGALSGVNLLPDQFFTSQPGRRTAPPISRPRPVCPEAPGNVFPDEPAPLTVPSDRRPKVGAYRWKNAGTVKGPATGGIETSIDGFEERLIRSIVEKGPSRNTDAVPGSVAEPGVVFTYETVQPDLNGNIVVSTFQVDTAPAGTYTDVPAGLPVGPKEVRTGGPERGIALKKLETLDRDGKVLSTFEPLSGLLLLPLPVAAGEDFVASAVDPITGTSASFQGQVLDRGLIDACGEVVDAWTVRGTQTFSGAETVVRDYELVVSTGLGGIPVREKIDQTGDGELHLVSTIGQLTPTPLAAP